MPAELFEDSLELQVETAESIPLRLSNPELDQICYPYPRLRPTGQIEQKHFRTLLLENTYLRVTVLPDLGGRIYSLFDKRTQREVLPHPVPLKLLPEGPRGVWLAQGLQIIAGHEKRMGAMGTVDFILREAPTEEDPAQLVLFELIAGIGVGWHVSYSLAPDEAALTITFTALNRTLLMQNFVSGVRVFAGEAGAFWGGDRLAFYSQETDTGLAFLFEKGAFARARQEQEELCLLSSAEPAEYWIEPRRTSSWSLTLLPLSGLGSLSSISPIGALGLDADFLRIQVNKRLPGGKVFLLSGNQQTLETPADLFPEHVFEVPLKGIAQPQAVALRDAQKNLLLDWDSGNPLHALEEEALLSPQQTSFTLKALADVQKEALSGHKSSSLEGTFFAAIASLGKRQPCQDVFIATDQVGALRHAALLAQAVSAIQQKHYGIAASLIEDSLLYNGDDALAWWLRAVALRHAGPRGEEESAELLNAHYLAPLEPALRAESFLAQNHFLKEPHPTLKALSANPEALIDVACLLAECGLFDDLTRLGEEALRHREQPMLRYLMAWSLLEGSRMEVEAAEHVRIAAQQPLEPPFPWRPLEKIVLQALAERYPNDSRLKTCATMVSLSTPKPNDSGTQ